MPQLDNSPKHHIMQPFACTILKLVYKNKAPTGDGGAKPD